MKLTKKEAIAISRGLWEFLEETGRMKFEWWDGWKKYGKMEADCALCEYDSQHGDRCKSCPYYECYGDCAEVGSPYSLWHSARTPQGRKKFAKLFLAQLKEL